jgi:hypothetical protein
MGFQLLGQGVQVYLCQPKRDDPSAFEWAFRGPEADLLNGNGEVVGRHFAGPTWEGNDRSRVVGEVRASVDSPDATAIPWLLLQARENHGGGLFSTVTYVQRLQTTGGRAPTGGCGATEAGRELRVAYTAIYAFYYPSAPPPR